MSVRTAYVANYTDEGEWDMFLDDPETTWYGATFPIVHPSVLVSDTPTDEWLDPIKKDAVEEYLDGWEEDDDVPALAWTALAPESCDTSKSWSQQHHARDAENSLRIMLVVRRVEAVVV